MRGDLPVDQPAKHRSGAVGRVRDHPLGSLVELGLQRSIHRQPLATDEPLCNAAYHDALKERRSSSISRNRPWQFFENVEWSGTLLPWSNRQNHR